MRPNDVLFWVNAKPFAPFRIVLNSGRTYDIRHPELVRVMLTSVLVFTPTDQDAVYDRAEMLGMVLIDHIEPLGPAASPGTSGATIPPAGPGGAK